MSKAKVRSMQRGAQKRSGSAPVLMSDIYKKHPPQLASLDKPHLNFLKYGKPEQVRRIKVVVEAAKVNGIGTASEIAHLLNKLRITTAIGEKWTPRLAWFAAEAVAAHGGLEGIRTAFYASSVCQQKDRQFKSALKAAVRSRMSEIQAEFSASSPTLADVSPELANLKRRLAIRSQSDN